MALWWCFFFFDDLKRGFSGGGGGGGPDDDELNRNRADCDGDALRHRLLDDYHKARLPKVEDIETPLFSAAN